MLKTPKPEICVEKSKNEKQKKMKNRKTERSRNRKFEKSKTWKIEKSRRQINIGKLGNRKIKSREITNLKKSAKLKNRKIEKLRNRRIK